MELASLGVDSISSRSAHICNRLGAPIDLCSPTSLQWEKRAFGSSRDKHGRVLSWKFKDRPGGLRVAAATSNARENQQAHQRGAAASARPLHSKVVFQSLSAERSPQLAAEESSKGGASSTPYASIAAAPPPQLRMPGLTYFRSLDGLGLALGLLGCAFVAGFWTLILSLIPTLKAVKRAAAAVERLADTTREELPGTMQALRLTGMEISDLTTELSGLSQDIGEGMRSSARAVKAAEDGLRKIGNLATNQTIEFMQERASIPVTVVSPTVAQAAQGTKEVVAKAREAVKELKTLQRLQDWFSRRESASGPAGKAVLETPATKETGASIGSKQSKRAEAQRNPPKQ